MGKSSMEGACLGQKSPHLSPQAPTVSVKWKNPEIALLSNGFPPAEVKMLEQTAKADSSHGSGGKGMAVTPRG